jgi:chaperone BCS1
MFSMPPKMIDVLEERCTIYCNQINEDYSRTLDTLYLQEESELRLFRILENFRDNKDRLISLGIKHKLNILLHGLPGTGKSTTIHAVASYLKRDIYYLNLNEITTNQQLKDIFDYLGKTVVDGGIIVIEDIDAMTPVVLSRDQFTEEQRQKNTELTLEFFLNILQGTLTRNDSIFIVTTNYINKLDPAFTRAGRFDSLIELKYANHYQISKIYRKILDRSIPNDLLLRIEEYKYSPADFIHHFIEYIMMIDTPDEEILAKYLTLTSS